jgi:hypothetical protein
MLNITVAAESAASPERVLALAGTDFSARRAKVWGNVKESRLAVHERGATHVEVTEYGTGPAWFAWERSRYDWSEPDRIRQTIDSNVHRLERARAGLHLGAARAAAPRGRRRQRGGDDVRPQVPPQRRRPRRGRLQPPRGRRAWGWYLRQALKAVEVS